MCACVTNSHKDRQARCDSWWNDISLKNVKKCQMFSDEQKFRVYNPSSVWGKPLYFPHTDEGLYTWNVCLFFGRYLLLSGIFCNETITSSSIWVQVSPFYSPFIKAKWGLALVINISLFLVGEQRRRENRNKTATNLGLVSRKSRGNFPGCLRRRRSKPSSACAGYNVRTLLSGPWKLFSDCRVYIQDKRFSLKMVRWNYR